MGPLEMPGGSFKGKRLVIIAQVLLCIARSAAQPTQGVVELYLTNPGLDSYPGRDSQNTAYFGVLQAGTPGKQFTGCFDTGSADAWLPLSTCQSASCQSHTTFDPSASSTYQATDQAFSIQYATGAVYGNLAYETLSIGGITVPNQAVGMVYQAGKELLQSSCDGIIGFGFQSLSQLQAPAPFYSMAQDRLLTQNVFSFWFSQTSGVEPAGELVIGGVNSSKFTGTVNYMPVINTTYWAVPLHGATVADQPVSLLGSAAILDTSSTAISMTPADAAAIHRQIPGAVYWPAAGLYNISGGCAGTNSQPTVSFMLGDKSYAIPPSLWVIKYMGGCVSGFVPVNTGLQIVLGVPFLRAWHSQYYYDPATQSAKVGLAASVPSVAVGSQQTLPIAFAGRKLAGQDLAAAGSEGSSQPSLFSASIPSAKQRGLVDQG